MSSYEKNSDKDIWMRVSPNLIAQDRETVIYEPTPEPEPVPDINEFTINNMIATDYMFFDEKKALEVFRGNNFGGVNHSLISLACLEMGDTKELLNYSTNALITNLFGMITSSTCMILALACTGKKDKYEAALDLADTMIGTIRLYQTEETGYLTKYEAFFHVMTAYIHALLRDEDRMIKSVRTAKRLAKKHDEHASRDVASHIRFYYAERESFTGVDSIGNSAVNGISELLEERFVSIPGLNKKVLRKIREIYGGELK